MFARVMHIQAQPSKLGEVTTLYEDLVVPNLYQQKGFLSTLVLSDASTGKAMSISIWESQADQLASDQQGHLHTQVAQVMPLLAAPPQQEDYQVILGG
jgi:quinol monooxygenase YgiN